MTSLPPDLFNSLTSLTELWVVGRWVWWAVQEASWALVFVVSFPLIDIGAALCVWKAYMGQCWDGEDVVGGGVENWILRVHSENNYEHCTAWIWPLGHGRVARVSVYGMGRCDKKMKYGYEWADRKATGKIQNLVRCTRCIDLLSLCCFLLIRLSRQLYANDLSSLPEGIFDPLISLNTLYVSRNYMLW